MIRASEGMSETMGEPGLFEAICTQRQVTRFKPYPVPIEHLKTIVDAATKAPSSGNQQPWEFVVVTDPARVRRLGDLYRQTWMDAVGWTPPPDEDAVHREARHLAAHMDQVPAIVLVCVDHSRTNGYVQGRPITRGRHGSSIWPAVQNLLLAARGLGLGSRVTVTHELRHDDFRAIVGLPSHIEIVCLTPVGYPASAFGPPRRRRSREVTSFDVYGNRDLQPDNGTTDHEREAPGAE